MSLSPSSSFSLENGENGNEINASAEEVMTGLQLRLHATNLPKHGRAPVKIKLPNAYCVVNFVNGPVARTQQPTGWGMTEVVERSCHPQWTSTLEMEHELGTEAYFHVQVLRKRTTKPDDPQLLGGALFEVGDILGTRNHTKVRRLPKGGCIFANLEPIDLAEKDESDQVFRFRLRTLQLLPRRSIVMTDPTTYMELAKKKTTPSGNRWICIYRSPPVFSSSNPSWDMADIDLDSCCDGNVDCPVRISVWIYKKRIVLGTCETTCRNMMNAFVNDENNDDADPDKNLILSKPGASDKEVGRIRVIHAELLTVGQVLVSQQNVLSMMEANQRDEDDDVEVMAAPVMLVDEPDASPRTKDATSSFKNYIDGGCEIDLCVAIDFTSSNGDPRDPSSLHYQLDESLNDYEEVIREVGDALAPFSTSKMFPVLGFGAKFGGEVRHIFQVGPNKEAKGVDGILQAYRSVFASNLIMSGPTVLDQVIQSAAMRANRYQNLGNSDLRYCVLLIITDGIVEDLEEIKRKLKVYSQVPLSVIIAGVGRAEFHVMHSLTNIPGSRQNAAFVEYRQHQHDPSSLAKAALEHVPKQMVEYFQIYRYKKA